MLQIKAALNKTCASFPPGTLNPTPSINPIQQIQKLDSVHDFGGTRGNNLATDTITKMRETDDPFSFEQMRLSFIQKYSFNNNEALKGLIPPINIQDYSNFSSPGIGQKARIVDDIENFLLLSAIDSAVRSGMTDRSENFLCKPTKPEASFAQTKIDLATFFTSYIDDERLGGTGKINFMVDTPGDLTKILKSDKSEATNNFAYILTQESAHDSAKGKPTTLSPSVIDDAYKGNGFCETFNDTGVNIQQRSYILNGARTNIGNFESNFTITFEGMKYQAERGKENFYTKVTYDKSGFNNTIICPLNGLVHPTNVPQITKDVSRLKDNTLKLSSADKEILVNPSVGYIPIFYNNFNNPSSNYNYNQGNQNLLDFYFGLYKLNLF